MSFASDAPGVALLVTADFDIGTCPISEIVTAGQFCADDLGEPVDAIDPHTSFLLATFMPSAL
jgi:hypothetical protein